MADGSKKVFNIINYLVSFYYFAFGVVYLLSAIFVVASSLMAGFSLLGILNMMTLTNPILGKLWLLLPESLNFISFLSVCLLYLVIAFQLRKKRKLGLYLFSGLVLIGVILSYWTVFSLGVFIPSLLFQPVELLSLALVGFLWFNKEEYSTEDLKT